MNEKTVLTKNQKDDVNLNDLDKIVSNVLTKLRIEKLKQKLVPNTINNNAVFKSWLKSLSPVERKFLAEILLSQKSELEKPEEIIKDEENAKKKLTDKELAKKENDSMEVKILVNVRKFGEDIFSQKLLAEFRSPIYGVPFLIYYGIDNAVIGECCKIRNTDNLSDGRRNKGSRI